MTAEERTVVSQAVKFFNRQRYQLIAYVVMDDHVHVLATPHENRKLDQIIHSWKSFSSHQILKTTTRKAPLWQDEYFDRIIRNPEELTEKIVYIEGNPIRRWPDVEEYSWVEIFGDWD